MEKQSKQVCCVICESVSNIFIFPHRGSQNDIVGLLYVCLMCLDKVASKNIEIKFVEEH
jgi:hypothetical protein